MSFLATLDRFVHRSRLDLLTPYGEREARSFRWLPLPALALMPFSFALCVAAVQDKPRPALAAWATGLFLASWLSANLMRFFGPRLGAESIQMDERERAVAVRARSIAGTTVSWIAIYGCFYAAAASLFHLWMPSQPVQWTYIGLTLQGWWILLPVLIASWLQPRPQGED